MVNQVSHLATQTELRQYEMLFNSVENYNVVTVIVMIVKHVPPYTGHFCTQGSLHIIIM